LHDITECRDLISLQALLFSVLFLQAISDFRGCHTLVGVALRSAVGMGLHRHLPHTKMSPIEDQTRRRLFHVVRQMDIYTSTILGFPLLLSEEDFDQELPTEVDDEQITKHSILPVPPGSTPSIFQAFNARAKLMAILAKILKHVYPLRGVQENGTSKEATTYMISYARIQEIERDLRDWLEELPPIWRPSPEGPIELVRYVYPCQLSLTIPVPLTGIVARDSLLRPSLFSCLAAIFLLHYWMYYIKLSFLTLSFSELEFFCDSHMHMSS
jgi:hypothetical protein